MVRGRRNVRVWDGAGATVVDSQPRVSMGGPSKWTAAFTVYQQRPMQPPARLRTGRG
jgi:hypothetical protein